MGKGRAGIGRQARIVAALLAGIAAGATWMSGITETSLWRW